MSEPGTVCASCGKTVPREELIRHLGSCFACSTDAEVHTPDEPDIPFAENVFSLDEVRKIREGARAFSRTSTDERASCAVDGCGGSAAVLFIRADGCRTTNMSLCERHATKGW